MKTLEKFLLALPLSLLVLSCSHNRIEEKALFEQERVVQTVADNSVLEDNLYDISNGWEYYENLYIQASLFYFKEPIPEEEIVPQQTAVVNIPHIWDNPQGTSTYHLRLQGLKKDTSYSIFLYDKMLSAGDLYCNGKFVHRIGKCTSDWRNTVAKREMAMPSFYSDGDGIVDLVVHVSNKDYRIAGICHQLLMSETHHYEQWFSFLFAIKSIFIGLLLIIIIYQFALFVMNDFNKVFLFLSVFTFFILMRMMFSTFPVGLILWPDIPYEVELKFEYIPMMMAPMFYFLYMKANTGKSLKSAPVVIFSAVGIILLILCEASPVYFASRLVPVQEMYLICASLFGVVLTLFKTKDGKRNLIILDLLGVVVLFVCIIHDVFGETIFYSLNDNKIEWILYGIIIFTILQSVNIAWGQYKLEKKIKRTSEEMVLANKSASRFVPQAFLQLIGKSDITNVTPRNFCRKKVSIICTDIHSFTTISEGLDASEVFKMLNIYMDYVTPIIRYYGGFIEKVLGDGVIAVFAESTDRALLCALEMQEAMVMLQSYLTEANLPTVEIGVGVHYGEVVLGTVGNKERLSEVIISPAVDEVMGIEAYNRICGALVIASEECVNNIEENDIFDSKLILQEKEKCRNYKGCLYSIAKSVKFS